MPVTVAEGEARMKRDKMVLIPSLPGPSFTLLLPITDRPGHAGQPPWEIE